MKTTGNSAERNPANKKKAQNALGDLFRWATEEDIIYTRAIKEIPKEMRSKLPPTLAAALEIHAELSGPMLHRKVSELVEYFNTEFEMTFPPLNFPFLIYKHMKELFLPVEVYPGKV
ncbi:hypothetical protein M7I_1237 [Glarea lozoyensis 74030]|uniref:Rrn7/TAF1B C-terminal cyclin domain-containing protein n=1 Tax=Glarea lozoyensis (strain ATCC 74030 / MF5533) TaxID=1104152 RepID=H0EFG3_GLAL7|nr:hypothetical protein M7I_1237 [Glarea lozoyensis 74030]